MYRNYFIVGDFNICGKVKSCLIKLCVNETQAHKDLEYVTSNPSKDCLGNIHIESEDTETCWCNGNLD